MDREAAPPPTQAKERQVEKQRAKSALGDTRALAEPEDALGKDEAAIGAGVLLITPARTAAVLGSVRISTQTCTRESRCSLDS
jgi:hypothetical protein